MKPNRLEIYEQFHWFLANKTQLIKFEAKRFETIETDIYLFTFAMLLSDLSKLSIAVRKTLCKFSLVRCSTASNSISSWSQPPTELHEIVCASACEPSDLTLYSALI